MAEAVGVSKATVQRVWRDNGLKPHLTKTFKVSNDPHFVEKLVDIVGLYLDPPEHAHVLSCDEKTSIEALDRTQKSLPIYPGRLGTMTSDYKRNGTTTLFAALEVVEGKVIAQCVQRHRHQEWNQRSQPPNVGSVDTLGKLSVPTIVAPGSATLRPQPHSRNPVVLTQLLLS